VISEEKMVHIVHLIVDGIYQADMVDYPDEEGAMREAKRCCVAYVSQMEHASEAARTRIRSQKNAPQELSSQWENLYHKYLEEELRKLGG